MTDRTLRGSDRKYYETMWDTIVELSSAEWQGRIERAARRIARHRPRYEAVAKLTGVPWPIIGAIHHMENPSFDGCLMNGQPWNRKTTIAPKDHGPWDSWEDAAVEALEYDGLAGQSDWGIGATGIRLERYNGGGYLTRGVNSPYLWSGCQHGLRVGKYVADGRYDPDAMSQQVGAMVILKRLASMGLYHPGEVPPAKLWPWPIRVRTTRPSEATDLDEILAIKGFQIWHNIHYTDKLKVDGWYGAITHAARCAAFGVKS